MGAIILRTVITVEKKWRRWCGPRSDLVRATETAADVLRAWTGYDAVVELRLEEEGGVTESGPGLELLTSRHPAELENLVRVVVTVRPNREQWDSVFEDARKRDADPPPRPDAEVDIKITGSYGTALTVRGDERTSVEGLAGRLAQDLGRATTNSPGIDRDWFFVPTGLTVPVGALLGWLVSRWLGLASIDARLEAAEVVGAVAGGVVVLAVSAALWWVFPPVEILDEGGAGRARRFRGWIFGVAGALVVGVAGSFMYDQVS